MTKKIVFLLMILHLISLGPDGPAFAQTPGPGKKSKDDKQASPEAIALISGISNIEFQTKVNDKERWDYYALFRHEKCLSKLSNEISIVDQLSGNTLGMIYTEATFNLTDVDTIISTFAVTIIA
jgi:hypothetical protein